MQGLLPTREIVQNLGSAVAKLEVSQSWVTQFLHRHADKLTTKWSTGINCDQHKADSGNKYCCHPGLPFLESARYFLAECSTTFTFIPLTSCAYAHLMYITLCIYSVGQSTQFSSAVVDALSTAINTSSILTSFMERCKSTVSTSATSTI
jgi:hypothetical protein